MEQEARWLYRMSVGECRYLGVLCGKVDQVREKGCSTASRLLALFVTDSVLRAVEPKTK